MRGEIAALPSQEVREALSYRSHVDGVMHACGHDTHGSIALGIALLFHRLLDNLASKVRVFLEPPEEAELLAGARSKKRSCWTASSVPSVSA